MVTKVDDDLNISRDDNGVAVDELPDDMNDYSWSGNLWFKIWSKYKMVVIWFYIFALIFAGILGAVVQFVIFTNTPFVMAMGGIAFMWLGLLGVPVIYMLFMTKTAYVLVPDRSGRKIKLVIAKWFRKDYKEFKLSSGHYDRGDGQRYIWLIKQGERFVPFTPYDEKFVKISGGNANNAGSKGKPTSAELAGILQYRDTCAMYANQKAIGIKEAIQYTIFAIILSVELVGIWFLSNRIAEIGQ